jgi:hypothetical protein
VEHNGNISSAALLNGLSHVGANEHVVDTEGLAVLGISVLGISFCVNMANFDITKRVCSATQGLCCANRGIVQLGQVGEGKL